MNKSYLTHISLSIFVLLALTFFVSSATAYETSAECVNCHGSFTSGTYSSLAAAKSANPAWPGTLHDVHRNSSASIPPGMLNGNCNACHFGASRTPVYTYKSNGTAPFNLSCSGCHDGPGLRAHHFNSGADNTCYDCHTSDPTPDPENVLRPVYTATLGTTSGTTTVNDPCNPAAAGFEGRIGDVKTIGLDNDGNLLYDSADPACKPAVAVLSVSPTTLAFGNQTTSTTSATKTVTISNTGTVVLTVNSITNGNTTDFVLTAPTAPFNVAVGGSQTFTLAFKPAATGVKSATVSIASNGGSASVSATGTGVAPKLGVSPTTLSFGNQTTGTTSAAQTVTISNTGTATLNVTSIASSGADFKFSPTTVSPIAVGGTAALSMTFAPVTAGAKSATINITSDGGSDSVSATGTGTQPTVTVPNVAGMTQAAATTAITGAGLTVGTVTTQSSSTVAAGNVISQNPASGASVAAGSAVNLVVSSGPAPVTVPNVAGMTQAAATTAITGAGLKVGTVTTQSSSTVAAGSVISQNPASGASVASGSAVDLMVSSGPVTASVLDVSPVNLTFDNLTVGSSTLQTVTISNKGGAALTVDSIANSNDADFVVTSPTTPSILNGGESLTFTVAFRPASTGTKNATISISSAAGNASVSATGAGTLLPAGDVGLMGLSVPAEINGRVGRDAEIDVDALAIPTELGVKATVTLTAASSAGVRVRIGDTRITKEMDAEKSYPTKFGFEAKVLCARAGTWPVTWTAKISASRDSDLANDIVTATTQVVCTNAVGGESLDD